MASKKKACCCNGYCANMEIIPLLPTPNYRFTWTNSEGTYNEEVTYDDFDPFGFVPVGFGFRPDPACVVNYEYPTGYDSLSDNTVSQCSDALTGWIGQDLVLPIFKCQAVPASISSNSYLAYPGGALPIGRTHLYRAETIIWHDENGDEHTSTGFFWKWRLDMLKPCMVDPTLQDACANDNCSPNSRPERGSFNGARGNIVENIGEIFVAVLWDSPIGLLPNPINASRGALFSPPDRLVVECTANQTACIQNYDDGFGTIYLYESRPKSKTKVYESFQINGDSLGTFSNSFLAIRPNIVVTRDVRFPDGNEQHSTVEYNDQVVINLGAYLP